MRNQPLPLFGQFYTDDAHPWAMQDVCNWLPCAAESEGTRTPTLCKTPPGLAPFVQLPDGGTEEVPIPAGPIRGLHNADGRVFTVSGSRLWQITPQGVAIPRGSIGGAGRVRMAHNQQTFGNEVIIVNGSAGAVYNTQTQALTTITDDGYPGAIDVLFLDGYFIQIEPARRFAFHSDLADGLSYNTLDRFTSEVAPDPLVGMAAPQNELILFSERTAEFFENTGAAQQPFRSKRISMKRGAASRFGQVELDNTVFWLGDDGKFYVLDGYAPKRISTRPIEQAIRGLNWAQAFAFVWESEGHAVVYWTFPDGRTWGYDASQGRWHRRASYGLDRWRVNATAPGWEDGSWLAGDFQAGRLWTVEWGYPWEYQTEFISEVSSPVIHDHQNLVLMPRLEVLVDVGQPAIAPREFEAQPAGPTISGAAPDGVVAEAYADYSYTGTPGDAAIVSFTVITGALPDGLLLSNGGTISGTPTVAGTFSITVRVTDSNGLYADLNDTIGVTVADLEWLYQADAYGAGLGGTAGDQVPLAFGPGGALLIAAPKEAGDPIGQGARFYRTDNYGLSFAETYVATTLATLPTLMLYGNDIWLALDARSTFTYDGATFTYTAGAVSGSWAGGEWQCGVWTGSYFIASSNGSDGMFRSLTGLGTTWANIGANLPSGTSASTLDALLAFPGAGPNPEHGQVIGLRAGDTTAFVLTDNSGTTWAASPFSTATPGAKTFACAAQSLSDQRAVFVTVVANGADSGLEFIWTDDYGTTFDSQFVLFSAMPAVLDNASAWSLLRAGGRWFGVASQGGAGTESSLFEVSEDFTTVTLTAYTNSPAPLSIVGGAFVPAVAPDGSHAVYGWRKVGGTPALFIRREA